MKNGNKIAECTENINNFTGNIRIDSALRLINSIASSAIDTLLNL